VKCTSTPQSSTPPSSLGDFARSIGSFSRGPSRERGGPLKADGSGFYEGNTFDRLAVDRRNGGATGMANAVLATVDDKGSSCSSLQPTHDLQGRMQVGEGTVATDGEAAPDQRRDSQLLIPVGPVGVEFVQPLAEESRLWWNVSSPQYRPGCLRAL
jgi:hypothetical protein